MIRTLLLTASIGSMVALSGCIVPIPLPAQSVTPTTVVTQAPVIPRAPQPQRPRYSPPDNDDDPPPPPPDDDDDPPPPPDDDDDDNNPWD